MSSQAESEAVDFTDKGTRLYLEAIYGKDFVKFLYRFQFDGD